MPIPDSDLPQMEGLQIGNRRLSTSCGVFERPDHHRCDDLVGVVVALGGEVQKCQKGAACDPDLDIEVKVQWS